MISHLAYSDEQYLEALRSNQDRLVDVFYKNSYKMAYKVIKNLGVYEDDISEVYQESFCILLDNVQREDFVLTTLLSSYLIGICKNQARSFKRKELRPISVNDEIDDIPDDTAEEYEQIEEIKRTLYIDEFEKMKANRLECYRLLTLSFVEGKSNTTIAHILNKGEDVVKTQKSRCLSYLRKAIFKRI